ncbi:MAG: hypothetical protein AB7I57_01405 [Pirellulales bacterium]
MEPTSVEELLSLYIPLNRAYVALAGYNNGVQHFGWKYPGRTVVKTTGCGKLVRVNDDHLDVDAGVTLKRVITELSNAGRELHVVPNFSYIAMGTTFMVPVHGSASEVTTVGETIERVLLYDLNLDRLLRLRRGDPRFGHYMYRPQSGALVLRLRLGLRPKSRCYVQHSTYELPSAAEVWQLLSNCDAANVEIRKARARDRTIDVARYYPTSDGGQTLEVPKDSIGKLWDRLEENRITAWLFHTLVRRFGYHVELFLDEQEFAIFWREHERLPLSKIQLRLVRRDGMAHSPFGQRDCISADLFMRRSASLAFLSFIKANLPHAKFNPGKHSV